MRRAGLERSHAPTDPRHGQHARAAERPPRQRDEQRLVPLSPRLLQELRDYWKQTRSRSFLFPGRKREKDGRKGVRTLKCLEPLGPCRGPCQRIQILGRKICTIGPCQSVSDDRKLPEIREISERFEDRSVQRTGQVQFRDGPVTKRQFHAMVRNVRGRVTWRNMYLLQWLDRIQWLFA